MTLWEFAACMVGFAEFHGQKGSAPGRDIDEERLRQMGIEGFEDG